jgi:hypothetical protein
LEHKKLRLGIIGQKVRCVWLVLTVAGSFDRLAKESSLIGGSEWSSGGSEPWPEKWDWRFLDVGYCGVKMFTIVSVWSADQFSRRGLMSWDRTDNNWIG